MEGKTLELIYMPIRGRAESIRLLLSAAGVAFTDTAAGKDTLPELRQTSVLKSMTGLPVLKVHDATGGGPPIEVPQSYAILRFLARICNVDGKPLLPTDPMQAARADFVAETLLARIKPRSQYNLMAWLGFYVFCHNQRYRAATDVRFFLLGCFVSPD